MYRIARLPVTAARSTGAVRASPAGARNAIRYKITATQTSVGNDPDPALKKSNEEAKEGHAKAEPFSEGHSQDRTKDPKRVQDVHTEQLTDAHAQREKGEQNPSNLDAVNLSHGETGGQAEAQRQAHATPEGSKFQPGQGGEQVGGHANTAGGPVEGEGKVGQDKAPKNTTAGGVGQAIKNAFGGGPSNGFHTYARLRYPGSAGVPEEAVDKGARKQKDTGVGAEQTPHLPHHAPGQGDKMPAVQDNASLPSKSGNARDLPSKKQSEKEAGISSGTKGTNLGRGPAHELRPTGTASTPGSRAVDLNSGIHSPSVSPVTGPSATYTHVVGSPEPDSHQTAYAYSSSTSSGKIPSGTAPRSSTSTSPYPSGETTSGILKNEAGIGSSNELIREPRKGADEAVAKQEVGQAGDDVGGRGGGTQPGPQAGGRAYAPPSDVGDNIEDTLPKPINP